MKFLILLALLFGFILPMTSQNLDVNYALCNPCTGNNRAYGNLTPFNTVNIVSDYGMRIANGTRFHQGIDYAGISAGSALASIEGGQNGPNGDQRATVTHIGDGYRQSRQDFNGPKYIVIQGGHIFAYLHIFSNGNNYPITSGNFVLQLTNNNHLSIINLVSGVAISQFAGETVSHNGINYTTENRVTAGQLIAPIGDSGAAGVHLHLSCMETGINHRSPTESIDAWNFVTHEDNQLSINLRSRLTTPSPNTNCEEGGNHHTWGSIVPVYGVDTRNIIEAEISMPGATVGTPPDRYTNVVMNEDIIDIEIANLQNSTFKHIMGREFTSYFRIDPQGSNTIYPPRMRNGPSGGEYGGVGIGEVGCLPFAYRSTGGGFNVGTGHPHDYYFFPDFYLRIHKDHVIGSTLKLAKYPWDTRYTDGFYRARSRVTNIDSDVYNGNPIDFGIDNFKPFVREVGVNFIAGASVYTLYWNKWNPFNGIPESSLQLGTRSEGGIHAANISTGSLQINAILSEKMASVVKAKVPSLSPIEVSGSLIESYADGTEKWNFVFGTGLISRLDGSCHKIIFTGQDIHGNDLLDFEIPEPQFCNYNITKKTIVLKRTLINPDAWDASTASGKDEVHRFRLLECGGQPSDNNCIGSEQVLITTTNADVGQQNGSASLQITGYNSNMGIWWMLPNGTILSTNLTISNLAPGDYCYRILDQCCILSGCVTVQENCPPINVNPNVVLTLPSQCNTPDGAIRILTMGVSGGTAPYTFVWQDEYGNTYLPNSAAILTGLVSSIYTVTATDIKGCTGIANISLLSANYPTITADIAGSCTSFPVGALSLDAYSVSGDVYDFPPTQTVCNLT